MTTQEIIDQIAKKHLRIDTLQEQKSDALDFHDLAVWSIEAALKAAFEAGQAHQDRTGVMEKPAEAGFVIATVAPDSWQDF